MDEDTISDNELSWAENWDDDSCRTSNPPYRSVIGGGPIVTWAMMYPPPVKRQQKQDDADNG